MIGEDAMTLAAVDRLVHHSTIFEMNVESYRRRRIDAATFVRPSPIRADAAIRGHTFCYARLTGDRRLIFRKRRGCGKR
jgi:hypothetical protein